ncbi:MAG: aminoacyl-tRNA hydrolase [Gammaproteobacteria bacterium]|nr:aminoacyl-tRNA hydrolase [Gammaproteobacteria bacterium]
MVGLGNPGPEYEDTRHNAGFWFVDQLARRLGAGLRNENKFHGEAGKAIVEHRDVWLLKPMTFMNRSGQSVAALARFYKIEPEHILVVHDELDIPPGDIRLKKGGGHGGHNGLRDIITHLGSKEFMRLRVGIGHPGNAKQVASYVLKKPSQDDRISIENALDAAESEIADIVKGEHQLVMNRLHTK